MAFRFTDLLVNIARAQGTGHPWPCVCFGCFGGTHPPGAYFGYSIVCGLGTHPPPPSHHLPFCFGGPECDPAAGRQQLATLKKELEQALIEIEKEEKRLEECAHPQTIAEIDKREARLREELEELNRRKRELEGK